MKKNAVDQMNEIHAVISSSEKILYCLQNVLWRFGHRTFRSGPKRKVPAWRCRVLVLTRFMQIPLRDIRSRITIALTRRVERRHTDARRKVIHHHGRGGECRRKRVLIKRACCCIQHRRELGHHVDGVEDGVEMDGSA